MPFSLSIDLRTAVTVLRKVVDEFGSDHVATKPNGGAGCVYAVSNDGGLTLTPVCIVAQLFARMGILRLLTDTRVVGVEYNHPQNAPLADYVDESLNDSEQEGICNLGGVGSDNVIERLADFGVTFTPEALTFLKRAQSAQDDGQPWGSAVEDAAQSTMDTHNLRPVDPRSAMERLVAAL